MKNILAILFLLGFCVEWAEATPGQWGGRSGVGTSRTLGRAVNRVNSSRTNRGVATGTGFLNSKSSYQSLGDHEAAAERKRILEAEYQEQLRAIKEGRYVPPVGKGRHGRSDRAAELEEKRLQRELELEERRLARLERMKVREEERSSRRKKLRGQKGADESDRESGRKDAAAEVKKVSSSELNKKKEQKELKKEKEKALSEGEKLEGF